MAIWVVFGHIMMGLPSFFTYFPNNLYNYVPVDVFIILSGFVITYLLDKEYVNYRSYIVGRAFRIFPVYLVTLLVSTLSLGFAKSVLISAPEGAATAARIHLIELAKSDLTAHVLANVTLLQGLLPNQLLPAAAYTIVGQAWSLTLEWQFYLIAPFLFVLMTSLNKLKSCLIAIAVIISLVAAGRYFGREFLGNNLPLFGVGFTGFLIYKNGFSRFRSAPALMAIVAVNAVALYQNVAAMIIWWAALFCVAGGQNKAARVIHDLLASKFAIFLGRISYPLYMIHMQAFFTTLWLANELHLSTAARVVALPLIGVPSSLLMAYLLHHAVEMPFHNIGRRLAAGLRQKNQTGSFTAGCSST